MLGTKPAGPLLAETAQMSLHRLTALVHPGGKVVATLVTWSRFDYTSFGEGYFLRFSLRPLVASFPQPRCKCDVIGLAVSVIVVEFQHLCYES